MDEQRRLTDLIPRRLSIIALLMFAGLACVLGLEALYTWMPELAPLTKEDGRIAAFDLDGEGSLAVWFSSVTLLAAAVVAVIIYTVRRHRSDDYQGRYRIWLAAAACWLLMSIDETSSLHEGFKEMMSHATGTRLLGDGSIWWAAPYFFLLGVVGSRLVLDMRQSKLSVTAMIGAAICYVVAVVAQLGYLLPDSGARGVMLEEGAEMIGNLFVLLGMGLYARHVILDAEGLLPHREPKADEQEPVDEEEREEECEECEEEEEAADEWIKIDTAHETPQPVLRRKSGRRRQRAAKPEPEPEPEFEEAPVERRLTKQEKKALRKRLQRERSEREKKQHKAWN